VEEPIQWIQSKIIMHRTIAKCLFFCIHYYFILYVLIQECPSDQTLKHAHVSSSTLAIIAKPCYWISCQINHIIMQKGRRAINIYHLCLFCIFNISVVHSEIHTTQRSTHFCTMIKPILNPYLTLPTMFTNLSHK